MATKSNKNFFFLLLRRCLPFHNYCASDLSYRIISRLNTFSPTTTATSAPMSSGCESDRSAARGRFGLVMSGRAGPGRCNRDRCATTSGKLLSIIPALSSLKIFCSKRSGRQSGGRIGHTFVWTLSRVFSVVGEYAKQEFAYAHTH